MKSPQSGLGYDPETLVNINYKQNHLPHFKVIEIETLENFLIFFIDLHQKC